MKLKPINDRIVIKPAPAEEKTKGNLMSFECGDSVVYGKCAGQELSYEGVDYLIMREDDVLVVIS
mgnify:CR=1 FL=1